jgi:putative ABC transport system permease protein
MFSMALFRLSVGAILAQRMRSFLTSLGIAVGVAAVVLLTSIGDGVHQYVLKEFTQFGSNIIGINPGKSMTQGGSVGMFGSVRPLTIEDAEALRRIPQVTAVTAAVQGNAEIEAGNRARRTTVYGVDPSFSAMFNLPTSIGRFLPDDDPQSPRAYVVLGSKVKQTLFGAANPIGERVRISGSRYSVIGVMAPKGNIFGIDMDDVVFVPTAKGLELMNREGLFEIDLLYADHAHLDEVVKSIKRVLTARHGDEDFMVTTQEQMLESLGDILAVLTLAVGALGGISLFVGAIGILTIMTIAVTERTAEIGLYRALGASRQQVLWLFLGEAVVLASLGGVAGLALGAGGAQLLAWLIPAMPVNTPWDFVFVAQLIAVLIGIVAGVFPAMRAARLDPVEALRAG